jgi:hypothetical protein
VARDDVLQYALNDLVGGQDQNDDGYNSYNPQQDQYNNQQQVKGLLHRARTSKYFRGFCTG